MDFNIFLIDNKQTTMATSNNAQATNEDILYENEQCAECAQQKPCALLSAAGNGYAATFICKACSPMCWKCECPIETWDICSCE
jgi:hypothetical protein